ncbi:unnamed protein product, partial [Prorocentrum cordatum]
EEAGRPWRGREGSLELRPGSLRQPALLLWDTDVPPAPRGVAVLPMFLAGATADVLKKEPCCVLSAGDSVWIRVPFGWNPIVLGVGSNVLDSPKGKGRGGRPRAEVANAKEFVSVLCHIAFDSKDKDRSKKACNTVAGDLTKNSTFIPNVYKQLAGFKTWKAALEAVAEPPAPEEQAAPEEPVA